MLKMMANPIRKRLLRIPLILVMIGIIISGLLEISDPNERMIAAILMIVFAVVLFAPYIWQGGAIRIHAGLAVLSTLAAVLLTLRPGWSFFPILFFLLAPMAMIYLPLRAGVVWISIFVVITGIMLFIVNGPIGLAILLPYAAGYVFFAIFGRVTVEAEQNRVHSEQLLTELQTAHQQLRIYADQVEELTITQERNRIAREMHDTLGHRLTIASVQLEGAQRLITTDPERAALILKTVREQVKEGLTDLRRAVAMLRASVDEDLPLDKALIRLVEQVQQATDLVIHLSMDDYFRQKLTLPQHQALYRAAQEALTNIQRHAHASEAWLQLSTRKNMIELLVSDNGMGFSSEQVESGFGLLGLKERADLQGGDFFIDKRAGGGTQVTMRIPIIRKGLDGKIREDQDE